MGRTISYRVDPDKPPKLTAEQHARLDRLEAMPDSAIDYSEIPELDDERFAKARATKQQVTLRLDREVLDWFRAQGRGYQTRMNAVLRAFVEKQTGKG